MITRYDLHDPGGRQQKASASLLNLSICFKTKPKKVKGLLSGLSSSLYELMKLRLLQVGQVLQPLRHRHAAQGAALSHLSIGTSLGPRRVAP